MSSVRSIAFSLTLLTCVASVSCRPRTQPASEIAFRTEPTVSARQVDDFDLGYLLTHVQVVAESPLPHLLPPEAHYQYRIMGLSEQGNCVPACPRSMIFIAIWNYTNYPDGHIQLYRIEGVRFWRFLKIDEFKAEESNGYFLSFRFQSVADPQSPEEYVAKIGFGGARVEHVARKDI